MGTAMDRIGPRRIVSFLPLVSAFGAFLFASSQSLGLAFFARLLIGIGMACVLMGTFKVLTGWFSPNQFATMIGLTYSVGTLGNILATSPLAYLASLLGWRLTFVMIGVVTILLCAAVLKIVTDRPGGARADCIDRPVTERQDQVPLLSTLRILLKNLTFWQISAATFFRYGTFVAIQGLWGGPYLMETMGYSPIRAGNTLMMMSLGGIIGAPLGGRLSDRVFLSRKKVVMGGMCAYGLGLLFLLSWFRITHEVFYYVLFFYLGFFSSFGMILYSHVKEIFDIRMAATAMTAINFFTMMGAAVFMQAMGKVIELFPIEAGHYAPQAYNTAFLSCIFAVGLAIAFYSLARDTKPVAAVAHAP
jgi:sugar phosphate permease